MKFLFIISLFFSTTSSPNISYFRKLFAESSTNEMMAKVLLQDGDKYSSQSIVYNGYYGAGKMIMAKYYLNPYSKLSSFSEGKSILESSIEKDTANVELRYLRLTIQNNAPSFLGYKSKVDDDRNFLTSSLSKLKDEELKTIISKYLQQ